MARQKAYTTFNKWYTNAGTQSLVHILSSASCYSSAYKLSAQAQNCTRHRRQKYYHRSHAHSRCARWHSHRRALPLWGGILGKRGEGIISLDVWLGPVHAYTNRDNVLEIRISGQGRRV